MRPSFHPRLINDPLGDPGVVVDFTFRKHALLFDMGDMTSLNPSELLKVRQVFISHTHMDHFIGLDQLLRLLLGRNRRLVLYGPEGFLDNITAKLGAYTWNLVHNYDEALVIEAAEYHDDHLVRQTFDCRTGFAPSPRHHSDVNDRIIHQATAYVVRAAILDHQIPSLAFSLEERFHVNILRARLDEMGLAVGPWLARFKELIYQNADPMTEIEVPLSKAPHRPARFSLGVLKQHIVRVTRGQKIAYVADAVYQRDNEEKIVSLAREADHLFIEAAFLHSDQTIARAKYHLTARQAGQLARLAGVRQLTVFHHSPRYTGQAHLLAQEAAQAFEGL